MLLLVCKKSSSLLIPFVTMTLARMICGRAKQLLCLGGKEIERGTQIDFGDGGLISSSATVRMPPAHSRRAGIRSNPKFD